MQFWKVLLPLLASSLCLGAQSDRISGTINSSQVVALTGNVHGLAQSRFDLGSTDGGKTIHGVTVVFHPSPAQQADLDNLLAQQQDRSSPNFHKWLTPPQFADRFGMSQNDIARVTAWLESEGFTVTSVANSRNQISFDGTVAQIESVFRTEIHTYLVDGETHFANATNPSVPAAMAGSVLAVGHLHDFNPKPRAILRKLSPADSNPLFTSHVSGNHFLAPGDFATIYDVQPLYSAGILGSGQKIVLTGQSSISLADVANFRSAAGLSANVPTLLLEPGTGTSTRCTGDETESDLDVEWSGGVAQNASITLVYAGLVSGNTCTSREFGAFDALQYAIDQNLAPVISNSYGNCESAVGSSQAQEMRGWIQQANTQGQTVLSASGDSGAADCDYQVTTATQGLAVDIPAAIPEVTGMGGTEFNGDAEATVTSGNANATQYWSGTTGGTDTISSALSYIPEMGWNDTTEDKTLVASGGGTSIYFSKPTWQTGTGVPADGKRDVPDLALNASADHDPYLFCSEDGPNNTIVATCTSGFRDSSGNLAAVGGTSAAAPTFGGMVALLNDYLGASGLGNVNVNLYALAASNPSAFHDVTTGNNIVPCTSGTTGCPASSPFQYGFTAGTGYDQVTGLGSVDGYELAQVWAASRSTTTTTVSASPSNIYQGASVTFTAAVTPSTATGKVSFYNNGSTTALGTATLSGGTATLATTALPAGADSVMAVYDGNGSTGSSTSATPAVVNVTAPFTLSANPTSASVPAGQTATYTITVTPTAELTEAVSVTFTNSTVSNPGSCSAGLPTGALCNFSQPSVTVSGTTSASLTLTITTTANMALPTGAQSITVTGTSGSSGSNSTPVSLTVTASTETFTLSTTASTFPVAAGATAAIPITVGSTNGFINTSNNTTILPLTYTCSGIPSSAEISCQLPNSGQPSSAPSVTLSLVTTPATTQLRPFGPSRIFYALLLPGLFGVFFAAGSHTRAARLLGLIVVLGCSTLWLGACSGGSGTNTSLGNPGTPAGQYTVNITATTGGANPITASLPAITLTVQ